MSRLSKKEIYLDNAASTPVDLLVKKEMMKAVEIYGNPSSFNDIGRIAKKEVVKSRQNVARFIGAKQEEVIFTSSGSEANNMAILGLANSQSRPLEIITTPIEHPSVLEPIKELGDRGWKVTYLKVDSEGLIDLDDLKKKLNSRVFLISVIYANNEIGTIQPIKKISRVISDFRNSKLANSNFKNQLPRSRQGGAEGGPITDYRLLFHTDACQAAGYLDMNVNNLGVDLLTFNGSKIYGSKGIGVLYFRRGVPLRPLIFGGNQEHGFRAGTENLPAIAGLATAVSLVKKEDKQKIAELRDYFLDKIQRAMPDIKINGPLGDRRLLNNINISIPGLDSENLLLELDKYGIYAGSGSACTAHSIEPSHVLKAIGVESKYLTGVLRLSLGRQTTKKNVDYVLEVLPRVVTDLYKRYKK